MAVDPRLLCRWFLSLLGLLLLPLLGACERMPDMGGLQSALHPEGPAAAHTASLWWVMFWGAMAILGLVLALSIYVVRSRPENRPKINGMYLIIAGGVLLPLLTLTPLLFYGIRMSGDLRAPTGQESVRVEVIGHQWWWEVRYLDRNGRPLAITANEMHIPAGQPVEFIVRAADVIHSFWVPKLAGKIDLIPGMENRIVLQASQPGRYRGQCAEYCGVQHAHMAFWVVAEPDADFRAWIVDQQRPAIAPHNEQEVGGKAAFQAIGCAGCHSIRGTQAQGIMAPDLTHIGSRQTLGAGTMDNSEAALARWIVHNQDIKPGNKMPSFEDLDPLRARALAAYLWSLK